ncbi:MAG: hypothetical protein ACI8P0_005895 [Planctomycetaceae bacterium]|jgi:hypothetical protein
MKFQVVKHLSSGSKPKGTLVSLVRDGWDDFTFKTTFIAYFANEDGTNLVLGPVKIAQRGMVKGRTPIPSSFEELDDSFFSLGQTDEYYAQLQTLSDEFREQYFASIRDVAFDQELLNSIADEDSFKTSLLRGAICLTRLKVGDLA